MCCIILTLSKPAEGCNNRDLDLPELKRYVREGWPKKIDSTDIQEFKKYAASLSVTDDCLINGN